MKEGDSAIAAIAIWGAPLAVNAISGPALSEMSTAPAAIACATFDPPTKLSSSIASPFVAKIPYSIPTSSGVNPMFRDTALPTRRIGKAWRSARAMGVRSATSEPASAPSAMRRDIIEDISFSWPRLLEDSRRDIRIRFEQIVLAHQGDKTLQACDIDVVGLLIESHLREELFIGLGKARDKSQIFRIAKMFIDPFCTLAETPHIGVQQVSLCLDI